MKSSESTTQASSAYFIDDWINSFNLIAQKNLLISKSNKKLDYLITNGNIGILIVDWKKPISVKVVNTAIHAIDQYNLNFLYLICKQVSDYAAESIKKLNYSIKVVHPYGLTDIAIALLTHKQTINEKIFV